MTSKIKRMTHEQRVKIVELSKRYNVQCCWDDWHLDPFDLPSGWVSGWVGGNNTTTPTIYVGIAPDGTSHS